MYKSIAHGWHDSFGWLRRSDLDEAYDGYMYECPDGHLLRATEKRFKKAMYVEKLLNEETGEFVFEISRRPRTRKLRTPG